MPFFKPAKQANPQRVTCLLIPKGAWGLFLLALLKSRLHLFLSCPLPLLTPCWGLLEDWVLMLPKGNKKNEKLEENMFKIKHKDTYPQAWPAKSCPHQSLFSQLVINQPLPARSRFGKPSSVISFTVSWERNEKSH